VIKEGTWFSLFLGEDLNNGLDLHSIFQSSKEWQSGRPEDSGAAEVIVKQRSGIVVVPIIRERQK